MNKKRILMIDDEVDFCNLVKANLELVGNYEVTTANSGEEGLKSARGIKPDLILLDVMMPGMSGFEVLRTLKEDIDVMEVPVVMLTGQGDDESRRKASELYDELYITKPVDTPTLWASIEDVLRRKGAR